MENLIKVNKAELSDKRLELEGSDCMWTFLPWSSTFLTAAVIGQLVISRSGGGCNVWCVAVECRVRSRTGGFGFTPSWKGSVDFLSQEWVQEMESRNWESLWKSPSSPWQSHTAKLAARWDSCRGELCSRAAQVAGRAGVTRLGWELCWCCGQLARLAQPGSETDLGNCYNWGLCRLVLLQIRETSWLLGLWFLWRFDNGSDS